MGAVSSVVSGIGNALSSVASAVGDAVNTVGRDVTNFVENPAQAVNKGVSTAGNIINATVKNISKNPVTAIADIAAIASGNPELIQFINPGIALAQGQDPAQVIKGIEAGLITNGIGMAGSDLAHMTDNTALQSILTNKGVQQGVGGALTAAVNGQDPTQALTNGLIAGGTGALGSQVAGLTGSNALGNITGSVLNSAARNGNPLLAFQNSATKNAISGLGNYAKSIFQDPVQSAHGGSIMSKIEPELLEVMQRHMAPKHYEEAGSVNSSIDWKALQEYANPKFEKSTPQLLTSRNAGSSEGLKMMPLTQMSQGPLASLVHKAHGGLSKYHEAAPEGHHPEFITGITGYYAGGRGTGQSDDIPAMLHDGDYVIDAEAVSALGDGSSKAGNNALMKFMHQVPHEKAIHGEPVPAKIADGEVVLPASFVTALGHGDNKFGAKMLDGMREELREHKRSAPTSKIPPKAKSPLDYLKMAKG